MNNFSPNMLKTYKLCPKKYYFKYIENLSMPQSNLPFEKGKKIHALAHYKLQGINIDRLETSLNNKEKETWNLLQSNEFYNKDFYKSEFQINIKIDSYWIGGRIDAIVKEGDNYYILDYKTGSIPNNAEFDFQTMVYLLCANRYIKNYRTLSFVYINLKDKNNYIIPFNQEVEGIYRQEIISTCKTISCDKTFLCNYEKCKNCEYYQLCK